jgi:predicted glycosyltransferase
VAFLAWQSHKIATLTRERDEARLSLASYQATLDVLQADTAAKITALEAEGNRQTVRVRNLERLLGQIEGASDEKNGIVAPVLRDAIDGLYGADPSSKADKAGDAAKPSGLRGRAATAKP